MSEHLDVVKHIGPGALAGRERSSQPDVTEIDVHDSRETSCSETLKSHRDSEPSDGAGLSGLYFLMFFLIFAGFVSNQKFLCQIGMVSSDPPGRRNDCASYLELQLTFYRFYQLFQRIWRALSGKPFGNGAPIDTLLLRNVYGLLEVLLVAPV